MKANDYISKRERKLLLIFAFATFVFVLSVFIYDAIRIDNLSNSPFSGSVVRTLPGLHFLTLFIFIALLKTKRFILSSFLTSFYAVVFIYGLSISYYGRLLGGEEFSPKVGFYQRLYRQANSFDYLAAFFISILLFWQISILLRMLIKTLQKEQTLP